MDACAAVKDSATYVTARAQHVRVDDEQLEAFVQHLLQYTRGRPPAWDEGGWHYADDAAAGGPLTAAYVLVLDALNWCFWPSKSGMEYDALALGLTAALRRDPSAFSADRLASIDAATLASWFVPGGHDLPNLEERVRKVREIGAVLRQDFGGDALTLIRAARGSAVRLVGLLTAHFPGFRDEAVYEERQVRGSAHRSNLSRGAATTGMASGSVGSGSA
jgi:hypothetical protein